MNGQIYVFREVQPHGDGPLAVCNGFEAACAAAALLRNFPGERFFMYMVYVEDKP